MSKDAGETAIKYLFTINAGGAVAVLAYLGALSSNNQSGSISIKISLILFFIGIVLVGIYKAHAVHYLEGLFEKYKTLVDRYYSQEIGWRELLTSDDSNVSESKWPYIYGYGSFICFILGSIIASCGFY